MRSSLKVELEIPIKADAARIWQVLTDPEIIKRYLFGTNVITDWKVGSAIEFEGEFQGKAFRDKGNVLSCEPEKTLQYNYWSGFSGMEDVPENYSVVTYRIEISGDESVLKLSQQGFSGDEAREHTEKNWLMLLETIRNIAENEEQAD